MMLVSESSFCVLAGKIDSECMELLQSTSEVAPDTATRPPAAQLSLCVHSAQSLTLSYPVCLSKHSPQQQLAVVQQ
jgi:hypothetical protein